MVDGETWHWLHLLVLLLMMMLSIMSHRSAAVVVECSGGWGRQARIVGMLDDNGLGGAVQESAVELGDGHLGLAALVEAHKADALGRAAGGVHEHSARYDGAVRGEERVQLLLARQVARQAAHVQVGRLDGVRAGPGVRHLERLVLQLEAVDDADGLSGVGGAHVADEAVAEVLLRALVHDELALVELADRLEQSVELLAHHRLRQVVDDQVGAAAAHDLVAICRLLLLLKVVDGR